MTRSLLCLVANVAVLVGCSSAAPEPAAPNTPTRTLGLAFEPGPCVEGKNTVAASAFVGGPGERASYLKPTDGELLLNLVVNAQQPATGIAVELKAVGQQLVAKELGASDGRSRT